MLYVGKLTVGKVEFSVSVNEAFTSTGIPRSVVSLEIANTMVVNEARKWARLLNGDILLMIGILWLVK